MENIGFFDSGVGGVTVWNEVVKALPQENTIFLADSKNAPYGQKSTQEIIHLSEKNTEYLLNQNSKLIVVACNTATAAAIKHLRQKYKVPFVGIEPAIKPAALQSQTKVIGVLATQGTLTSGLFHRHSQELMAQTEIRILEQIGQGLVELIEQGKIQSPEMEELLQKYLSPMLAQNMDYLVLGCTHYPHLLPVLRQILPPNIRVIEPSKAVAKQVQKMLENHHLLTKKTPQKAKHLWLTNANPQVLSLFLPKDLGVLLQKKDF